MIDFSLSPSIEKNRDLIHAVADGTMRPISREYDEREHEKPTEWLNMMWEASKDMVSFGDGKQKTAYEVLRSLVGSEMCIRDRLDDGQSLEGRKSAPVAEPQLNRMVPNIAMPAQGLDGIIRYCEDHIGCVILG